MARVHPWTARRLLGRLLSEGREGVGRSPERVEDVTGVSGRTVRRLEEGTTLRPRLVTVESLANFYGLDPDFVRQLVVWGDIEGDELDRRIGDLAAERFGDAARDVAGDVDDPVPWLAMRLARAGRRTGTPAWGTGRVHPLAALAANSGIEFPELDELLSDLERLDRRRIQLVRELVRELRVAQDKERSDAPINR